MFWVPHFAPALSLELTTEVYNRRPYQMAWTWLHQLQREHRHLRRSRAAGQALPDGEGVIVSRGLKVVASRYTSRAARPAHPGNCVAKISAVRGNSGSATESRSYTISAE
jgi:hypothetical protein